MYRIVFISPYRDLSRLAQSVAAEIGMDIEFYDGCLEESVEIFKELKGSPIDILMSRGGTAECLAENCEIPVVRVNTGPFDIIECIDEARRYATNIVFTSFSAPVSGLPVLEKAFGVTITNIIFKSLPDLEKKIAALAENGKYCIAGGGPTISFAQKYGLPGVFVRTSRETLHNAFLQAIELIEIRRREKRLADRFKTILECAHDGIIAVDADGKVEIYNKVAEQIMGIEAKRILGQNVSKVIPNTRLDEVLKTGKTEIDELQEIGDIKIITSRVPLKDGEEIVGAVASFKGLSNMVQVEHRIRKELSSRTRFRTRYTFSDIVAESPLMQEKVTLARNFARSDLTVLVYGPTGTGKELFAQSIHCSSSRAGQSFVAVNCGALPTTLLESELFGYEDGAFTGARRKGKLGLFELAHGGTIFLDEIDSMPIELQGRLLRVLQEKEVLRLGGEMVIPINVRIIAATNQPPLELLAQKQIREDLFYRLNVLYLEIPPLSARKEDIENLCLGFIDKTEKVQILPLLSEIMPYFKNYQWPGNVRELRNIMQRLTFFSQAYSDKYSIPELLTMLAPNILNDKQGKNSNNIRQQLQQTEEELILATVKERGSVEKAAEYLGIGRSTIWRKLKRIREEKSQL